jgi:hypothetical protein
VLLHEYSFEKVLKQIKDLDLGLSRPNPGKISLSHLKEK